MIKRFCDVCGEELTKSNTPSSGTEKNRVGCVVQGKTGRLTVEVHHAIDCMWDGGDVCKYCIIDAVNKADDRPKAV